MPTVKTPRPASTKKSPVAEPQTTTAAVLWLKARATPVVVILSLALLAGVVTYAAVPALHPSFAATTIPGDINGDGRVDIFDLSILLSNFGKTG